MADIPFSFSQVPGDPSFRNSAVNCVAIVPLLSTDKVGEETQTASVLSYQRLCAALQGQGDVPPEEILRFGSKEVDILLVVPNSSLTRPGDWRYQDTPLKSFHWQYGSQRLRLFDGRPQNSRLAHDRVMNHSVTRDWIDLCPSRRTAAVIGVLNMRDCKDQADLERALEELHQWANRYATPPFEVTAHGRSTERDKPVERLYVFDSFDEDVMTNLNLTELQASVLAFPPLENIQMMDMHLNVVVNDLAVSIFRSLESKIVASDAISEKFAAKAPPSGLKGSLTKMLQGDKSKEADAPTQPTKVSLTDMAAFVSPKSKLAKESSRSRGVSRNSSFSSDVRNNISQQAPDATPKLLTPLDQFYHAADLSPRDIEDVTRRDLARREKWAADISLMAGSPLDAYERYLRAADMCRAGTPDPLWYASALEGCAAAHIAMAEAGGFGVDEYLEQNFQMPDDIMALAKDPRQQSGGSNRQVLPEVVFALCEEALNITNRHEKLAPMHAELLLKLADYVAESAEAHLRCRWGEGPGCYGGELGDIARSEKASVSKLSFSEPKSKVGGGDMIHINSFNRTKQVCELLQEAVSVGSLNPTTRVDVAARCARLCLDGVRATQWAGRENERIRLPRKAAFFAVVAAETMTVSNSAKSATAARDLWLLASRLYAKEENSLVVGGSYGWAALRATALQALSMQGNTPLSNQAAQELLELLSEIQPKAQKVGNKSTVSSSTATSPSKQVSAPIVRQQSKTATSDSSIKHGETLEESDDESERNNSSVSTFARQLRAGFASITPNSTILTIESKWADGPSIAPVDVPFSKTSQTARNVRNLGCVWLLANQNDCSIAQEECMQRIMAQRRTLPTSSVVEADNTLGLEDSIPISIMSGMNILIEPNLTVERVASLSSQKESEGVMATFYNPFDKAKKELPLSIIAEEEERFMVIKFGNRLCVPLEVQRCKLVFSGDVDGRLKASALSFVMPPKATNFVVHFPFIVLSGASNSFEEQVFEVSGIELTILGRVFYIPVFSGEIGTQQQASKIPQFFHPAYPYGAPMKSVMAEKEALKPRFEICASQPRLQILCQKSGAPVESISTFSISLANGEMFTLPLLELRNFPGPSSLGQIQRLQILAIDLPGLSDTLLFDTAGGATQNDLLFEDHIRDEKGTIPIRLRAITEALTLEGINKAGSVISFQISAASRMKRLMPEGTSFRLRFRYKGQSSHDAEMWRRQEVTYRISCISGPRLSSIEFRPDVSPDSCYEAMRQCLKVKKHDAIEEDCAPGAVGEGGTKIVPALRVGLDAGVHVASETVVFWLTIANETKSEIILSRDSGAIGGFQNSPITSLQVHAGVSARLPVVFPRLPRTDENSQPIQLIEAIISGTTLSWSTLTTTDDSEVATGRLQIPREALEEIIDKHPSFVQRICEPPCKIRLQVGGLDASSLNVVVGQAVDLFTAASIASWVPMDVRKGCRLTLAFLCSKKGDRCVADELKDSKDFVWVGKTKQVCRMDSEAMDHAARIVFTATGHYQLSACALISHDNALPSVEEVWLAPVAASISVQQAHAPQ